MSAKFATLPVNPRQPERVPSPIEQIFPNFSLRYSVLWISVIQVLYFACSLILSEALHPSYCSLYTLGGKFTPHIVQEYEVQRLILPIFLHAGFLHIIVTLTQINLFFQLRMGFSLEKHLGSPSFVFLYLLAGICGNLFSALLEPYTLSIGASTSLFGIFGAQGSFFIYHWHSMGPGRNLNLLFYGLFLLVNLSAGMNSATIDLAGHIGGFIMGFLACFVLLERQEDERKWAYIRVLCWFGVSGLLLGLSAVMFSLSFDCSNGKCDPCD